MDYANSADRHQGFCQSNSQTNQPFATEWTVCPHMVEEIASLYILGDQVGML
jgi:hypothetical protein